ncbi:prolyl oligopeptidase family serine peptidase [Novosphingobium sp. FSY-8]|uniref:prolyl oligopeptidase n=1 Tax=Novosphingobium ovatum TaxID=1908523 RepID=A0ABW9X9T7_9SPHN|nr:prolyl oligopeptidase family serine peptidase [Novosphingobium ovatum]NBC35285.1 prolyl oligopeptidase family serine peptidase [Novosphingobium ovatum]
MAAVAVGSALAQPQPAGAPAVSAPVPAGPAYPATRRDSLTETHFGESVADPYRWLEQDVRTAPEVAAWVEQQNALTHAQLAQLPARAWFGGQIKALMDYARYGLPVRAGGRYFYTYNSGLMNQAQLLVREGLTGTPRLLLDPASWAADGATALDGWTPSKDGKRLVYSVQDGGSDWRSLRVLDVNTGKPLADELRWVKFSGMAWVGNDGFLYSRYPEPAKGQDFQARNYNHAVYYHRIGTPQSVDQLVLSTPDQPATNHSAGVTSDGHYAVIISSVGTDNRFELRVIDLKGRGKGWPVRQLVSGFDHDWRLIDSVGTRLWFVTNKDAPRRRVVSIDLAETTPQWREVVPQRAETLEDASIVGDRLVLGMLRDAASIVETRALDGSAPAEIKLGGIGTAGGFGGEPGNTETFYAFTSFNRPATIYRLDVASGQASVFAAPQLAFNPDDFVVEQRFFTSRDGTRVPMFIVRSRAIATSGKPVPTLLYGYGGFDISLTPTFSATNMAWLRAGGAYVMANLRGGGEYGAAWHDAGRRLHKQNVFDDFIAAGEYLIAHGFTPRGGLAVQGRSNGGLLVGAVVNQRPDLFAAANPGVGVMDMLRFDQFTAGRYWVDDYGYPDKEADWRYLRTYSPYHNIRSGLDYPAVLVTTADTDDRVVPGHSFKYTAALQAASVGAKPHLIRIETRAGHGAGKPTGKVIEEGADVLAFLAHYSGLTPAQ